MENTRLFLFLGLSVVTILLWQAWQDDHAPRVATSDVPAGQAAAPAVAAVPSIPSTSAAAPGSAAAVPTDVAPSTAPVAVAAAAPAPAATGKRIKIVTDVFNIELDTVGGDLRQARLPAYPVSGPQSQKPFELLSDQTTQYFVAQSGLLSSQGAPDHYAVYEADQTEYVMAPDQNTLAVALKWTNGQGVTVSKIYTFQRGSYLVNVQHRIENATGDEWIGRQYRQLQRTGQAPAGESALIYTYTGGVIYSPEKKYEKIKFDDIKAANLSRDISNGWAAMIQHYFLAAWIPAKEEANQFYTRAPVEDRYVLGMVSPEQRVAAGGTAVFGSQLYVGPKVQDTLEQIAPGLELTVDYGWLTIIAKPLFWLLRHFHEWFGNWGWAIIVLTMTIKLAFYKLSETSYRSMAHMRRLQPKIAALRERYGDDRQRMSQAMMELYRKDKINPFGGCLPMIVQIPVFIALYWVLLESVELRQAPFILWIHDLSTKDPYYVLPLIMGVSMFVQQKLNPPPPDPVQAKVFMALPFIFTGFFAFFPAGLVLYWVANNCLSIAQQWVITRRIEKQAEAAKAA